MRLEERRNGGTERMEVRAKDGRGPLLFEWDEPCFERILFVLTLDRKKMKERILIGEEQQIRFRLNGSQNTEVLCDMTRPLGTFCRNFEHDTDRDWNLYGLSPLRQALHSNRWKKPKLEADGWQISSNK